MTLCLTLTLAFILYGFMVPGAYVLCLALRKAGLPVPMSETLFAFTWPFQILVVMVTASIWAWIIRRDRVEGFFQ